MKLSGIIIVLLIIPLRLAGQESYDASTISIGDKVELKSFILGETREIYIYQPQGLWGMDEDLTPLPVIYVLDGESQFNHTATTVDFLSIATNGNDFIPRSIVVGIPNTNRDRDLTPLEDSNFEMSGGGARFLDFITEELIPYIDTTFNTSEHRTIIGHSLGGVMAFEALLRKRTYFDNYLAIDPGFGIAKGVFLEQVIDTLDQADLSRENVFCSIANNRPTFLDQEDLSLDTSKFINFFGIPQEKFIESYETSNWRVNITTKYYPGENHYSIPHPSTNDGLRALYEFYTFPEITNYYHPKYQDRDDLVDRIKEHYARISIRLGYDVVPMQGYINSFAFGLSHFDREDLTIDLLRYNIELHPEQATMYNNLGYFYRSKGHTEEAIDMYSQSLELREDEWVSNQIVALKEEMGDKKR